MNESVRVFINRSLNEILPMEKDENRKVSYLSIVTVTCIEWLSSGTFTRNLVELKDSWETDYQTETSLLLTLCMSSPCLHVFRLLADANSGLQ